MELFHFDIECCGQYKDYITFKSKDIKGSLLFENKFEKVNTDNKYSSIDEYYIDNSGIISTYGKICCISFGFLDNNGEKKISSYYGNDEREIVDKFNNMLKKIESKNFNLSGFRIWFYDIPWLLHKYDIQPASIISIYDKKPWDCRIIDLSELWKQKFAWSSTFDEICYELDITSPKDLMSGKDVHRKYWEGNLEEIKRYCEKDISSSIDMASKMNL